MDATRGTRFVPFAAACALSVAALSACTPAVGGSGTPVPTVSAPVPTVSRSPLPTPQPTLTMPDTTDPAQVGAVIVDATGATPSSSVIAGPALLDGGTVTVRGECVGGSLSFDVRSAAEGEEQRTLFGGKMQCGTPWQSVYDGSPYAGPVQFVITESEDVQQGWLQAFVGDVE